MEFISYTNIEQRSFVMSVQGKLSLPQRIITTHDEDGKAIIHPDISTEAPFYELSSKDANFCQAYVTKAFPVNLAEDADVKVYQNFLADPPGLTVRDGTVLRYVDMSPGLVSPMHRTVSLDYGVVLEGEVELVLDSGETKIMKRGDVCIQRGTMHAWRNTSDKDWARMLYILQPINKITSGNSTLEEDELWRKPNPNRVNVTRPAWVHYGHPDLEKAHKFILDFGFVEAGRTSNPDRVFYRGYNDQPVLYVSEKTDQPLFFGGALEASSQEDLDKAAKLPGAGPIRNSDLPGGGKVVTIVDPENVPINIVYGYQTIDRGQEPPTVSAMNVPNVSDDAKARKGTYQRIPPGPAAVHKLGHFGHKAADIATVSTWYQTNFNLRAVDVQANPFAKEVDMAVFYDIDLGEKYRDHHAFFHFAFFPGEKYPGPHHASFEVHDFDVQQQGHYHLLRQGYTQMWGLGRHKLGSQIFDYWYDPDGFTIEHYADGDVINQDNAPERHVVERMEEYTIWGGKLNLKGAFEGDARPAAVSVASY
ncbi:Cupin-domain-containing oxidoreductase virC [Paramyrothecium foliicola]|nr:Cupin-domain-containing oxidoreductase virC [Paramyrothecium foliicola]